jgi:hypothetical protein
MDIQDTMMDLDKEMRFQEAILQNAKAEYQAAQHKYQRVQETHRRREERLFQFTERKVIQ